MPTNDLGDPWGGGSPFDAGWQSRIPPGWVQFADGTVGPPNAPSPFDQAWATRQPPMRPGAPMPLPGAQPPNPAGTAIQPYGGAGPPVNPGGPVGGPRGPAGPLAEGGPQIFGPQGSNAGTGKQVGPWTNPFSDAYINPAIGQPELFPQAGGGGSFNPMGLISGLAGLNPMGRAAIAGGAIMAPTTAETGELPLRLSGARPQHPASTGRMPDMPPFYDPLAGKPSGVPFYDPLAGKPSGVPYAAAGAPMPPPRPRTPAATATAKPAAKRQVPDLGYYRPTSGNARGASFVPAGLDPRDPRNWPSMTPGRF